MADSGDVVRRITISATGDGVDSTAASVNSLGDAFDSSSRKSQDASSSYASVIAGLAGVGAATVGLLAGMRAFVDYAGQQTQALTDIADHAAIASMNTAQFQQTMYAALSKGVSSSDFTSGMDKIAADLVAASQGTTEFTKLLEVNGLAINKNASEATKMKQALADIMTLMQGAAPDVQQKIASIVGVSASWIPFLKEGADQFAAQKQAALDLGIVIDDATISKAREFNDEWHTAVAAWDLQFKASMTSILPMLTQLAGLAKTIIDGVGGLTGGIGRLLTPVDQQSTAQLDKTIDDVERLSDMVNKMGGSNNDRTSYSGFRANILAGSLGLPEGASISDIDKMLDKIQDLQDDKSGRLFVTPTPTANTTKLAPNDTGGDALSRAMDQARKNADVYDAEAESVGKSAAAMAEAKAQAELLAAAQRAGVTVTQAQADKFQDLAQDVGAAVEALNKAKVASEISFSSQTMFASPEDVKIAQQLKTIYGNDVPAALASSEAAAIRMNDAMSDIAKSARSAAASFATDLVNGLKSGKSFADSLDSSLRNVSSTLTSKAFTDLFSGNWIQAGIEGAGAIITGILGGSDDSEEQQKIQAAKDARDAAIAAGQQRQSQFNESASLAGIDTSTVMGQLQAFDVQANQERADEMKSGGEAIVELEKSLAAQRQAIVDKANQQVLKSYQDFLDSIKTGSLSTLSPQDQLAYSSDRSEIIWLPEHVEAFMKVASSEMQLAMVLALHTGQRQADILRMAWSSFNGTAIALRQGKAKRLGKEAPLLSVKCTKALRETLEHAPRRAAVILATKTGLAFKKRYFAEKWDETCKLADIEGLHFHDIRGTTVTMLAEAGCTVPEIVSITGHSLRRAQEILDKYLKRTSTLAANAVAKFENVLETDSAKRAAK